MLSALALTAFLVTAKSGDASSGTGQHYNTAWEAVYDHNQWAVKTPHPAKAARQHRAKAVRHHPAKAVRHHPATAAPASHPAQRPSGQASPSGLGFGSAALGDIPGVPYSFAACVAYRESTNGTNPAANGNVYGIIPASGDNVSGDSLAQQKLVFKQIYDTSGPQAWAADGC